MIFLAVERRRLGGGARYVGDRPGDSINSFFLPSYVVADIFATYETKVQATPVIYQLNVKNLFDTEPPYSHNQDTNTGSGRSWEPRVADPRGRSLVVGVGYKFF